MDEPLIRLDLSKMNLYGWEGQKSKFIVDAYADRVKRGDIFPPVPIYRVDGQMYQLTKLWKQDGSGIEGGHTRAIAHFMAEKPLECIIKGDRDEIDLGEHGPILIRKIILMTDERALKAYKELQKRDERYRI